MEISEVQVKLVGNSNDRLKAFCSITIDHCFVVRDIKVIDGTSGLFVAMPSRKIADRCSRCGCKNHLRAKHCNECGARLSDKRAMRERTGRSKLHADVAHPINSGCREMIQNLVVQAFHEEVERSKQPGYQPPTDFDSDDAEDGGYDELIADLKRQAGARRASTRSETAGDAATGTEAGTAPPKEASPVDDVAEAALDDVAEAPRPAESKPTVEDDDGAFGAGIV